MVLAMVACHGCLQLSWPVAHTALPPPCRRYALKNSLVCELCNLGFMMAAADGHRTIRHATDALVARALELGWTNVSCPIVASICRPGWHPDQQVWLRGPVFSAVLVWHLDHFIIDSATLCGLLCFFPRSPSGTGLSAIRLGDNPVQDLPVPAAEFRDLILGTPFQPAVPADLRASMLAGFAAFHEIFGILMT